MAATVFGVDTRRTVAYQLFALAVALLAIASLGSLRSVRGSRSSASCPNMPRSESVFSYRHLVHNRGPRDVVARALARRAGRSLSGRRDVPPRAWRAAIRR